MPTCFWSNRLHHYGYRSSLVHLLAEHDLQHEQQHETDEHGEQGVVIGPRSGNH